MTPVHYLNFDTQDNHMFFVGVGFIRPVNAAGSMNRTPTKIDSGTGQACLTPTAGMTWDKGKFYP